MEAFTCIYLFILFIVPGIIASFLQEWLRPSQDSAKLFFARAVAYTAVIGLLMLVLHMVRGHAAYSLDMLFTTIGGIVKYGVASFILSLVTPSLFVLFQVLLGKISRK